MALPGKNDESVLEVKKIVFAIEVSRLFKRFGGIVAVDGISFSVQAGSLVTLLGPSGCGKTTTLRIIAGLDVPTQGEVIINGEVMASDGANIVSTEKRDVGMVFQSYALWPHMTVYENVKFPLRERKWPTPRMKKAIDDVLDLVRLHSYASRYPHELSGGEQQRVALARALVYEPSVLLLDEPLANLDATLREGMREELLDLHRRTRVTALYVTHDQAEALSISDKIILMNKGQIIQEGVPLELYNKPANEFTASFLGRCNTIKGKVVIDGLSEPSAYVSVDIGAGRLLGGLQLESARNNDEVMLCIRPEDVVMETTGNLPICSKNSQITERNEIILIGTVERISYYGRSVLVCVATDKGTLWVDMEGRKAADILCGQQVRIRIQSSSVRVLKI